MRQVTLLWPRPVTAKAASTNPSIMACDLATAQAIAHVNDEEAALLTSRTRPIVLLRKRAGSPLSNLVAPGNRMVGVMLPYTPLHYLLLGAYPSDGSDSSGSSDSLTSDLTFCNLQPATCHLPLWSSPPATSPTSLSSRTTTRRGSGWRRWRMPFFHNREIYARCDNSVIQVFNGKELPVRRSRGMHRFRSNCRSALPTTLAVGGASRPLSA